MPFDGTHAYVQSSAGRRRVTRARHRLSFDYETFGIEQLVGPKSVGVWNYSVAETTEALMVAYRIDGKDYKHVDLTEEFVPPELYDALCDEDCEKWSFNAAFERLITLNTLKIPTPYKGWRCVMALANMQSFTGDLLQVGKAMGLDPTTLKDAEGSRLIKMFCGPQRITKKNPHVRRTSNTDPEDWEKFCQYNIQDVVAEDGILDKLIRFEVPDSEWEMYEIDQRINDAGMPVNRRFVEQAEIKSDIRKAELHRRMIKITGLANPNSGQKLLPWLREGGYEWDDLQKASVAKTLKAEGARRKAKETPLLSEPCYHALKLRRYASQTSVKKYPAILRRLSPDGNLRHAFQYGGAARTLRWAGRGPQPHNLTRTPKILEADDDGVWGNLTVAADIIENGSYGDLTMFHQEPMVILAGSVRSSFQAEEGHELTVCDLSAIESAVLAWLSGCKRMLKVFADGRDPYYDFGTELYGMTYEEMLNHIERKSMRTICKPAVLGCGFQLGGGTMKRGKRTGLWGYAENMGVDITEAEALRQVKLFRSMYHEIPTFWEDLDRAAKSAVHGKPVTVNGLLHFEMDGPYLTVRLPSGRKMYYYKPRIVQKEFEGKNGETFTRRVLSYMGKNQVTHQWGRVYTSGGKQTENVVQAVARDILKEGIKRAYKIGFDIRGHVHDEIVTQTRVGENYYTGRLLQKCMTEKENGLEWIGTLPLKAAFYQHRIYRKD